MLAVSAAGLDHRRRPPTIDADDAVLVAEGRVLYRENCAGCHGKRLEGQALWQAADGLAWRRAPAQDATGHSWKHNDAALLAITATGRFPNRPAASPSAMPGFAGRLGAGQVAVLAYIKSKWPPGLRAAQAALDPATMAPVLDRLGAGWTFPARCAARFGPPI